MTAMSAHAADNGGGGDRERHPPTRPRCSVRRPPSTESSRSAVADSHSSGHPAPNRHGHRRRPCPLPSLLREQPTTSSPWPRGCSARRDPRRRASSPMPKGGRRPWAVAMAEVHGNDGELSLGTSRGAKGHGYEESKKDATRTMNFWMGRT